MKKLILIPCLIGLAAMGFSQSSQKVALKALINNTIKQNGMKSITGTQLNALFNAINDLNRDSTQVAAMINALASGSLLPSQVGQASKLLITNGTTTSWTFIDTSYITQFYVKVRSLFTAGSGIAIVNGVITATGGGGSGAWADITGKPNSIAGYGITDAFTQSLADARYSGLGHVHSFSSTTGKPTTIPGYGITIVASDIPTLDSSKVTGVRTEAYYNTKYPTTATVNTALALKANLADPIFSGTLKVGSDTVATRAYARSVGGGSGGGSAILYSATGSNTDGAMTQASTTTALAPKWDSLSGRLRVKTVADSLGVLMRSSQIFNVVDYGAIGNGTTINNTAIQAAINAAKSVGGTVYFPSGTYKTTTTINILPSSGAEVYVNIQCGARATILYAGATKTAAIYSRGLTGSTWNNLLIDLATGTDSLICVDFDTDATSNSLHFNTFNNMVFHMGDGIGNQGWRMGHVSGGGADISDLVWNNCTVANTGTVKSGMVGWHNEGANTLQNTLFGCFGFGLDKMFSNKEYPGASSVGNGGFFFYSMGTSGNNVDFEIQNISNIGIFGGRFENGKRFLHVLWNNKSPIITLDGVEIDNYAPSDGRIIYSEMPCGLSIRDITIRSPYNAPYNSNMIKLAGGQYGGTIGAGRLIVQGGLIDATEPFYSLDNSTVWKVYVQGVAKPDAEGVADSTFLDLNPSLAPKTGSADIEITDATKGYIIRSPNGTRWRITINNSGNLITTAL